MDHVEVTIKLLNRTGLHARPAALFVQTASKFKSDILVRKNERSANAKNILEVLSLGAEYGDTITIIANGEDAKEAIEALIDLIKNKFHEDL